MRFYAGIGSRETPQSVLQEMTRIAEALSMAGYVLTYSSDKTPRS